MHSLVVKGRESKVLNLSLLQLYHLSFHSGSTDTDERVLFSLLFPASAYHIILLTTCLSSGNHHPSLGTSVQTTLTCVMVSPQKTELQSGPLHNIQQTAGGKHRVSANE